MNNDEQRALALAAADFLITNQLTLLRLTDRKDNMTLSIPTVNGIDEKDLKQILNDKFSPLTHSFTFEYFKPNAANGTTIIHINKIN